MILTYLNLYKEWPYDVNMNFSKIVPFKILLSLWAYHQINLYFRKAETTRSRDFRFCNEAGIKLFKLWLLSTIEVGVFLKPFVKKFTKSFDNIYMINYRKILSFFPDSKELRCLK